MSKKILPLNEAIQRLNELCNWDPATTGKDFVAKGTIYNAFKSKRLTRYGTFHKAMVDVEELLREFGPKRPA